VWEEKRGRGKGGKKKKKIIFVLPRAVFTLLANTVHGNTYLKLKFKAKNFSDED